MKKNIFNNRRFKHGSLATIMTVGLVALVVLVNVVASMVADRLPINIDLTDTKMYELSQESVDYLEQMEESVTIEVFASKEDFQQMGTAYQLANYQRYATQALELFDKYSYYGDVEVKFIDLYTNPDASADYANESIGLGSVVVSCGERYKVFSLLELFTISSDGRGGYGITATQVEKVITNAIMNVTNANPTKVTLLTGVTMADVSGLTDLLGNNGYEIQQTDILSGTIDPETEILILASPMADLPAESLTKIDEYLDNDGAFDKTFYYFADPAQPELPNIEAFLSEWGIGIGDGIVMENDDNKIYQNRSFIDQNFSGSAFADGMGNTDGHLYVVQYRPLEQLFTENANRTTQVDIASFDTSVLMPFDAASDWQPTAETEQTSYPAVILGQRTVLENDEKKTSTVVAFGSATIANELFLSGSVYANAEYLVSMSNTLSGTENRVIIADKTAGDKVLGISNAQKNIINLVFQYLLPLAIIIAGVVVWARRRNR